MDYQYRTEKDSLGEIELPIDAYYGIQTMRAFKNFPITKTPVHSELILSLAKVKKAAAIANMQTGMLAEKIGKAIIKASNEILSGKLLNNFIVDSIQGGAGTSINMNMNEVLANRALEILGKTKGNYFFCSPNSHVNMSQSTNDTISTALRIAAYNETQLLLKSLSKLIDALDYKGREFQDVLKMGRTHLQDAVPIKLGQEFEAYASVLKRDIKRIKDATEELKNLNIGATAVGTGLNAQPEYVEIVIKKLNEQTNINLISTENLVDGTQNTDVFTALSAALKVASINISKICNDLRLMASGPVSGLQEIKLPIRQAGSSIMPGKVNPVMIEVMNQVSFQVSGNDLSINMAAEAAQFELNVMSPTIIYNLLQSIKIMKRGLTAFTDYAIKGVEANIDTCKSYVENSFGLITALNPHLGYEVSTQVVEQAMKTGETIKEICNKNDLLSEKELNTILDSHEMTSPGIAGSELLEQNNLIS